MKDCTGNVLNIGDRVVFISGSTSDPRLAIGNVSKIYTNDKECSVDGKSHIYRKRIIKVSSLEAET